MLTLGGVSCGGGFRIGTPVYLERDALMHAVLVSSGAQNTLWDVSGPAPLELRVSMNYTTGEQDGGAVSDVIHGAALNFGDGTGWIDVTAEFLNDQDIHGTHLDGNMLHTYFEPGSYEIHGRLTYWDGEVVENVPTMTVKVLVREVGEPSQQ